MEGLVEVLQQVLAAIPEPHTRVTSTPSRVESARSSAVVVGDPARLYE